MPSPFDLTVYLRALGARWKRIAGVAAVAVAVALAGSLLLPKKYDSTVTVVIQPAGTGGPYPATMSPVYLEYLRSYEHFLQSDALLARLAADLKLDQRPYGYTAEGLRRGVLNVSLVRQTKVLKIRARFGDPEKAHQIALGLARLAAQSNTDVNSAEVQRAAEQIAKDLEGARARLASTHAALERFRRENRGEELSRQLAELLERKTDYQKQLSDLRVDLADKEARLAALAARPEALAAEVSGLRAREKALQAALTEIQGPLARSQAALASLELRAQELERNLELAQSAVNTFTRQSNEMRFTVAARHEELQIADVGIVPTRPSRPNIPLNVMLAAFFGLLAGFLYETWIWNSQQQERATLERIGSTRGSSSRVAVP